MKIAIDCADLDESRIDGTRVYIKNLLNYFGEVDNESQFFLYHRRDFNPLLKPRFYPNYFDRKIPYPFIWTQTRLSYELMHDKPDICWMPIQQIPFLASKKIKTIITVHDLAFKIFPESFDYWRLRKLNFFHDTAVKRADMIIAISETTKKDLLKFHPKIDEGKIKVVYHGFEKELFTRKFLEERIVSVKEKYKIKGRYLLYVGAIQPRKNLVRLIEAFEMFKSENKKGSWNDLKLVFVGEKAWKSELTIEKVNNSEFHKDIVLTGKVDFEELAILYNQAEIFVCPSIYEGFGIPILEAMASGVPVIIANNSSLIEIGSDAVEVFETKDSKNLFEKINKVLFNDSIRGKLIQKGFKRIENFSWKKCAEETLKILKKV